MAQVKNQSEHMFVEWAQGIQAANYDVVRVAELLKGLNEERLVGLDVGGGIGRYAQLICDQVPGCHMVVLDKSELAEEHFVNDTRLELKKADYFSFDAGQRYDFLVFKTVLHHFIADNESNTRELQLRALKKARQLLRPGGLLLIEENFYQGVVGDDTPGRLIFAVTRQRWIENLVRRLGANTAGEGVRFRSIKSWNQILQQEGFTTRSLACSPTWGRTWPLWQRLPLLSSGRFQGVLEASVKPQTGELKTVQESFSFARSLLAPSEALLARASHIWSNTSTKLRWCAAVIAVTGPLAITTCSLSEA